MFLEVFTTTGALSGSVLALFLDEWPMSLVLAALLGYMAYAAYSTRNLDDAGIRTGEFALAKPDRIARYLDLRGSYFDQAANRQVDYVICGTPIGMMVAYLAGITSGLLGVGGGVLKVSARNRYMNVPMKVPVGVPIPWMPLAPVLLILTPVARVIVSIALLATDHGYKFVVITSIVMLVIMFAITLGLLGLE